jgi:SAM-dependent methyltransferase
VPAHWPPWPGAGSSPDEPHRDATTDGAVLEIGAGTGRNLPLYRNATRVVALEPGPGMRARANHAGQAAQVPVEVVDGTAGGCHPNRDVVAAITAAGFRTLELDRFDFQIMPPLVRPHVLGVAQRPASHPSAQQAKGESSMNVLDIGAT